MKKATYFIVTILAICCFFSGSVFADVEDYQAPVEVLIEYNEGESLTDNYNLYDFFEANALSISSDIIDLAEGSDSSNAGQLDASESHQSSTYNITKSTIQVTLESLGSASEHIKVTLCKSNGSSVASSTVSLKKSNIGGIGKTTTLSFTNLDSNYDYYLVIENIDTVESGLIIYTVKQK